MDFDVDNVCDIVIGVAYLGDGPDGKLMYQEIFEMSCDRADYAYGEYKKEKGIWYFFGLTCTEW